MTKYSDPDLREYGCDPIPWRRVYGFAQNSQILDKRFLVGSIVVILIWFFAPGNALHLSTWTTTSPMRYFVIIFGYVPILILFVGGELERNDKLGKFTFIKYPIFVLGLVLLGVWGILIGSEITKNLSNIFSNPVSILMAIIILPLAIIGVIKWKIRKSGPNDPPPTV